MQLLLQVSRNRVYIDEQHIIKAGLDHIIAYIGVKKE
jgi:hypothetical protein